MPLLCQVTFCNRPGARLIVCKNEYEHFQRCDLTLPLSPVGIFTGTTGCAFK